MHRFGDGATAKALDGAGKALKSAAAALLFSADPDQGKVTCVATVSKDAQSMGETVYTAFAICFEPSSSDWLCILVYVVDRRQNTAR